MSSAIGRACLYARVSSELQEERGTVQSQLAELRRFVTERGEVVAQEYIDDGYSGELLERPALDRLRSDAKAGSWTKVYIHSPDRLARKPHIAGLLIDELQTSGVEVVFLNRPLGNTVEDHLLFGIQSLFAEYEKEKIKERQRRGKVFKATKGFIVGGQAPYGYRYVRDASTGQGQYEIDEAEAVVVRQVFEWYLTGRFLNCRRIGKALHEQHAKTRRGGRWTHSAIASMLSDSTYAGTTYYNKRRRVPAKSRPGEYRRSKNTGRVIRDRSEWIPAPVPPIVSHQDFGRVQELKARRIRVSRRRARQNYLVKNLITCGECGSPLYGSYSINTSGTLYCYYLCSLKARRDPIPTDHRFRLPRNVVDSSVWNGLLSVLTSPRVLSEKVNAVRVARESPTSDVHAEVKRIHSEKNALELKRQRTLAAYQEQLLTLDELKQATQRHAARLTALDEASQRLEQRCQAAPAHLTRSSARAIAAEFSRRLRSLSSEGQRELVLSTIKSVTAYRNRLEVRCELPANSVEWRECVSESASSIRSERNTHYAFTFAVAIHVANSRYVNSLASTP